MNKAAIRYLIILVSYLAVLYPLWVRLKDLEWNSGLYFNLFPIFGLLAFCIMWLHVVGGALRTWLEKYIDFELFVHRTSMLVLICLILHPLLLFIAVGGVAPVIAGNSPYIWLGIIGWFLLITYDIGKIFRERKFFMRNWHWVLIISTIGFILIFFHSLELGGDLQSGPLRNIWILYGVTAMAAAIYNYGVKRFLKRS